VALEMAFAVGEVKADFVVNVGYANGLPQTLFPGPLGR
jgi:hypothetical protein